MNTRDRIHLAAAFFSGSRLGFRKESDLVSLLQSELGSEEILDHPVRISNGLKMKAVAPRDIYHICASNLDVSAEMSLLLGTLLGSELLFKIPGEGLPGFEDLAREAGKIFGVPVTLLKEHDPGRMRSAEAVVVFGSDNTVEKVRLQTKSSQRFLAYGHKISIGLVSRGSANEALARRAAEEIIAYEQGGCLSPQAYLCDFEEAERWAGLLAEALENKQREKPAPALDFEESGLVFEARQRALLRGNRLWGAAEQKPWTVVLRQDGFLEPGPGHRFIQVIPGSDWQNILKPWRGKLSSLSVPSKEDIEHHSGAAAALGFSRVCLTGELQNPNLQWRHDGRPRLSDLVTWITLETDEP